MAEASIAANTEGEFNRFYRVALDDAGEGKWSRAAENLASASKLFPNSPDLQRFGRDVERAVAALPSWQRHPVASVVVGAGVAGVFLVGGFALFATARRARVPKDMMSADTASTTVIAPTGAATTPGANVIGKFTILNGDRAGEKLGLGGSGIRIGRESAICEIVLENPKVSRLHAEVVSIDGKVMLIDRNSSNGTYVNDQKIDRRFLKDGDIIHFGGRNAVAVAFHA
jgi:hypothetical protein